MNTLPSVVRNSQGAQVRLGRQLGKGGEGAVYEATDRADIAVKLYWPNKAANRRDKIGAMVAAAWSKSNTFVAYPIDSLFTPSGAFAGFIMRRIGGHKPVHMLYSPSSRKLEFIAANFRFLLRAALNAARAVASVHATECVIGDVNHSGFLVSDKATITLIDSDSFQVIASGKSFLCQVGTPEYTPPELQNSRFDHVKRTRNHDNFGLAILIFQLLFMGRHPFSGRFLGRGDMPLERAIAEFRFAYSADKSTNMEPPPNAPLLIEFPDYIAEAFEKAFGRAGVQERPKPERWIELLERLEGELQKCSANPVHHHTKAKPCPWCKMERAYPGFVAFSSSPTIQELPIVIDTSQVAALIAAVRDPGAIPDLMSLINSANSLQGSATSPFSLVHLKTQHGIALGASVAGFLLFHAGAPLVAALVLCATGVVTSLYPDKRLKAITEARRQAEQSWRAAQQQWSNQVGNTKFLEIKSEATALIRELNDLPGEEKRELQRLEQNKRLIQLERFLERHPIKSARIRKIGSGRKAVLASFGIETAADVEPHRIGAVQGFGPALVTELVIWRQGLEARFVFNPKEPINPAQIAAVKTTLVNKKAGLEAKLRSAVARLQQAASYATDQRRSLVAAANAAFARLRQARADERSAQPILVRVSKIASISCLGIILLNLLSVHPSATTSPAPIPQTRAFEPAARSPAPPSPSRSLSSPSMTGTPQQLSAPPPATPPLPITTVNPPPTGSPSFNAPRPPISSAPATPIPEQRHASADPPRPAGPSTVQPPTSVPPPLTAPRTTPDDSVNAQTRSGQNPPVSVPDPAIAPAPPMPPPIQARPADGLATEQPPPPPQRDTAPKLDLNRPADVMEVQQRLFDLGYLASRPDGKWGPRSAGALQTFRHASKLADETAWDKATEDLLLSAPSVSRPATPIAFVGNWRTEAGSCGLIGEAPPLRITNTAAETAGGRCDFESVRPEPDGSWRVRARCVVGGEAWQANIQLRLLSNRLTWSSERGKAQYLRCR